MNALDLIKRHEGLELKPYRDTAGKLTIGYGRNLDDVGISEIEAVTLLANDVAATRKLLERSQWFTKLNEPRQAAILDLTFNVRNKVFEFHQMIACLDRSDFDGAAAAVIDSFFYRQVGRRAVELSVILRTGEWPNA